MDKLMMV